MHRPPCRGVRRPTIRLGGGPRDRGGSLPPSDCFDHAVVVRVVPETRFTERRGGGQVAYQPVGDGPIDVLVNRVGFPVDMMWEQPRVERFLDRLSSFCRHIWFDSRGTGASDTIAGAEGRLVESLVDDMIRVV